MKSFARLTVVIAAVFGLGMVQTTAGLASGPSVDIGSKARFINDQYINVVVVAQCTGGGSDTVNVSVTQSPSQASNGVGNTSVLGYEMVPCDGHSHKLLIPVEGSPCCWNAGKADATASLMVAGTSDSDTIKIVP